MTQAHLFAAKDIACRWFAYFEGRTEPLEQHLDMFTNNICLVHAGKHLLANNRSNLKTWFKTVPSETSSHFIEEYQFNMLSQDKAELKMKVAYQSLGENGALAGALIDYQTEIEFDTDNKARFCFIQKTPVTPNPANVFSPSFRLNRIESLHSRLLYLQRLNTSSLYAELFDNEQTQQQVVSKLCTLSPLDLGRISFNYDDETSVDTEQSADQQPPIKLIVTEREKRYLTIRGISGI
ncbi:hypothetical protein [Vibrio sp. EA2]|uniref:hypothetical protein n=1 Tax=Vibrio sp. EA2 TaxID=3079860 RepID=UPI00294A4B37|nr:hypothetical protein [Vibrio sp. EA2]MDV6252591.1 hypothetical protein [Vibrio sp. EA2]